MSVFWKVMILVLCWLPSLAVAERLYINDKKVPEGRRDLEVIQAAVVESLPRARAATVCIKLDQGAGTGVVVSPGGLVLTAAHVSGGVGRKVSLVFEDGTEAQAETLGLDSERDAAMVQIVSPERSDWPHVEIDRRDSCRLGDWVFALGHSGGFDKARGVVLRVGRLIKLANFTFNSDCLLIGGDSGGPLFDLSGTLVAIHSRVGTALQENMHVPLSVYTENWDALQKGEFIGDGPYASRPVKGSGFLGIASEAQPDGGVIITKVGKETPAEKAGLQVGDVLLKANGQPLSKRDDLKAVLNEMAVGDELVIEATRGGNALTITLELGAR